MDTLVSVRFVVEGKRGENPQFDATSITIFLDRSYYLDSTFRSLFLVKCFHDLSKSTLTEEFDDIIWGMLMKCDLWVKIYDLQRSVKGTLGLTM